MQNDSLSAEQARDLRALAGTIIPASATYDVPGADDERIFADILRSLERDRDDVGARAGAACDACGRRLRRPRRRRAAPKSAAAFRDDGGAPLAAWSAWCCFATTATTG